MGLEGVSLETLPAAVSYAPALVDPLVVVVEVDGEARRHRAGVIQGERPSCRPVAFDAHTHGTDVSPKRVGGSGIRPERAVQVGGWLRAVRIEGHPEQHSTNHLDDVLVVEGASAALAVEIAHMTPVEVGVIELLGTHGNQVPEVVAADHLHGSVAIACSEWAHFLEQILVRRCAGVGDSSQVSAPGGGKFPTDAGAIGPTAVGGVLDQVPLRWGEGEECPRRVQAEVAQELDKQRVALIEHEGLVDDFYAKDEDAHADVNEVPVVKERRCRFGVDVGVWDQVKDAVESGLDLGGGGRSARESGHGDVDESQREIDSRRYVLYSHRELVVARGRFDEPDRFDDDPESHLVPRPDQVDDVTGHYEVQGALRLDATPQQIEIEIGFCVNHPAEVRIDEGKFVDAGVDRASKGQGDLDRIAAAGARWGRHVGSAIRVSNRAQFDGCSLSCPGHLDHESPRGRQPVSRNVEMARPPQSHVGTDCDRHSGDEGHLRLTGCHGPRARFLHGAGEVRIDDVLHCLVPLQSHHPHVNRLGEGHRYESGGGVAVDVGDADFDVKAAGRGQEHRLRPPVRETKAVGCSLTFDEGPVVGGPSPRSVRIGVVQPLLDPQEPALVPDLVGEAHTAALPDDRQAVLGGEDVHNRRSAVSRGCRCGAWPRRRRRRRNGLERQVVDSELVVFKRRCAASDLDGGDPSTDLEKGPSGPDGA